MSGKRLEKHIEADIIGALQRLGFAVTKTSQPRPSMITRGVPDLFAMHPTWKISTWLEVKTATGEPSAHQRFWHTIASSAGVNVAVVRSVEDTITELKRLGAPIT